LDVEQCLENTHLPVATPFSDSVPREDTNDNVACVGPCGEDDTAAGATGNVGHVRTSLLLSAVLLATGVLFYRSSRRRARSC
jgi:hypothetical protein